MIKAPKNPLIVTCTVDEKVWEFIKKNNFPKCHNDAEVMMQIFNYYVSMEEVDKDMEIEYNRKIFRF